MESAETEEEAGLEIQEQDLGFPDICPWFIWRIWFAEVIYIYLSFHRKVCKVPEKWFRPSALC